MFKFLAVFFCLILVSGGLSGYFVGSDVRGARASSDWGSSLLEKGFLSPSNPAGLAVRGWSYLFGETLDFVGGFELQKTLNSSKEQNSASILGHALTLRETNKRILDIQSNHIRDARNLVWAKIKETTVSNLNNDNTKQSTIIEAKEEIRDYYSSIQYNLNSQLSANTLSIKHLVEKNTNTSTKFKEPFYLEGKVRYRTYGDWWTKTKTSDGLSFIKKNVSLLNKSKQVVWDIKEVKIPKEAYSHGSTRIDPVVYSGETPVSGDGKTVSVKLFAKGVDSKDQAVINSLRWNGIYSEVNKECSRMEKNAEKYIEEVYSKYEQGELNISGLIDAETLVTNLNTQINETGYYAYAGVKLSLLGINTSLDSNFKLKLLESNRTEEGMLFTDHVPRTNGSFVVNRTYYPGNWSESCYLVGSFHVIDEPFRVLEIRDHDGNIQQEVGLSNYNRQTSDPSELKEELGQLQEIYNQTNDFSVKSGGVSGKEDSVDVGDVFGGLGETWFGVPIWVVLFIFTVLAYAYLVEEK
ncbi:MAG: Major capsid protein of His2 family of spindle-shaped halovirus [Candidatus Methanohalarchaeum thermophilum]|uniref:Major capsid protein of His2 family of spindle-shaped halovirus n=1 Tax=Methanohalarchaeum thermophilum TaxID=1903181 RepID=A0A1Q6DSY8_METT1|nr:MAG: Major capsid protein of His2 family of spindle-shaped halovirus [Candidatus Methanohalarchaeum thermophilum]